MNKDNEIMNNKPADNETMNNKPADNETMNNKPADNETMNNNSEDNYTAIQPDIAGYFPLYGNMRPKAAPVDGISDVPPDGKCADVFSDGIAVIQLEKDSMAEKVIHILAESGTRCRAVAADTRVRLFFRNNGLDGNYKGSVLCGVSAEIAGGKEYLDHLENDLAVIQADESYDPVPLWLCPVKNTSPLNSRTSMLGEMEWTGYMKQVYNRLKSSGKVLRDESHAATIETAKILNRHFRKHPFNERRMLAALDVMELDFDINNFYRKETDDNGKARTIFQKDKFSEWFIERYHLINLDHIAHRYSNGVYIPTTKKECESLLIKYLENSSASQRRELAQISHK